MRGSMSIRWFVAVLVVIVAVLVGTGRSDVIDVVAQCTQDLCSQVATCCSHVVAGSSDWFKAAAGAQVTAAEVPCGSAAPSPAAFDPFGDDDVCSGP